MVLLVVLLVVTTTTTPTWSFEIHRHVPVVTPLMTPRTLDVMERMRGGSSSDNNIYEDDDEEEQDKAEVTAEPKKKRTSTPKPMEDEEDDVDEATMPEDEETQVEEDGTEVDEGYEPMETVDDTLHGDGDNEEEDDEMDGEDTFVVETAVVDQEGEDEVTLAQDDAQDNDVAIPFPTTQEVLERATAGTTTDDENSSAFVDRMELADAYDIEDTEGAVVEDAEAMAAVSAIAGGSDSEEVATGIATSNATITDDMKEILVKELHFTPQDIKVLRPDIAAMLVANKLQKPFEGMPPNWYLPSSVTNNKKVGSMRQVMLKTSLTLIAVGVAALLVVNGQDSIDFDQIHGTLAKIPALLVGALGKGKRSSPSTALIEAPAVPVVPEEVVEEEEHPHSIKPGATEAPAYEQDLDKTPLDKFLTKIENIIKAFFRITI